MNQDQMFPPETVAMNSPKIDTSEIPRPFVGLRSASMCIQYERETDAQARERWRLEEEYEAECKAEEARLWKWKITPWWVN